MSAIKDTFYKIEYKNDFNPIKKYIEVTVPTVMMMKGVTEEEAIKIIERKIREKGTKDPIVGHFYRPNMEDKQYAEIPLSEYIENVLKDEHIIVPSFTTYLNHNQQMSIYASFCIMKMKERSIEKNKMFEALKANDHAAVAFHSVLEKAKKRSNNSLSGGFGSLGKSIYNISSHSTLTSTVRCVTSIGNGVTESIVSGNRLYTTPQVVIEHIMVLISRYNNEDVKEVLDKFRLTPPTVNELIMIIKRSTSLYFPDSEIDNNVLLKDIIKKLTPEQRAVVGFNNDLFHMRLINPATIRRMINDFARKGLSTKSNLLDEIKNTDSAIMNLTYHILIEETKGMNSKDLSKNSDGLLRLILGTAENISRQLYRYKDLIQLFLISDVMPINMSGIIHMARRCVTLSDTDSTCASYEEWVKDKFSKIKFDGAATGYAAAVMFLTTGTVDHYLKQFSANMNVPREHGGSIRMKNEYTWSVMAPSKNSKHYFALPIIREGIVLLNKSTEIKGKRFIAGKTNPKAKKTAHDMMLTLMEDFTALKVIDMDYYVKKVADIEREIERSILENDGAVSFFQQERIKNVNDYAEKNPFKTNYFNHILWAEVFADKYGPSDTPYYYGRKIPLRLLKSKDMKRYFSENSNNELINKFGKFLESKGKDKLGTIIIDSNKINEVGIPDEIKPIINIDKIIKSNCEVLYLVLETLGFFKNEDVTLKDLGY